MKKTNQLQYQYPITVRLAILCGIILVTILFLVFPRFLATVEFEKIKQIGAFDHNINIGDDSPFLGNVII